MIMARKTHDDIVKELNREKRYPNFMRTHDFRMLMAIIFGMCLFVLLFVLVLVYKELIDSKGQFVGVFIVIGGLTGFSYWALWGRKK